MSDKKCGCTRCLNESGETVEVFGSQVPVAGTRMVLCATCGNKRCPHAADHRHACTNSNEPGQAGSNYADCAPSSPAMNAASQPDNRCEHGVWKGDHCYSCAAPVGQGSATSGEADCYCGGFGEVHQDGCPEIAALAASAERPDSAATIGAHHLTPENIEALILDLEACQSGGEVPSIQDRDWRTRCGVIALVIRHLAERSAPAALDEYGETDFGFTFAGIQLEAGDKRLASLIVRALGTAHPAMDDLTALLFRSRSAPVAERAAPASVPEDRDSAAYQIVNWLRRQANAEKDSAKRAIFIEAHNAALAIKQAAPEVALPAAQGERAAPSEKPFPAPGEWFPVNVLGGPMREYAPGKWENAVWPSALATPAPTAGEASARTDESCIPPFAEPASQHCADSPKMQVWKPVACAGQVKVGDKLRFTIGDKAYSETAKLIINGGTDKEEVIYNKARNYYFITAMVLSGFSNHKAVEVLASRGRAQGGMHKDGEGCIKATQGGKEGEA